MARGLITRDVQFEEIDANFTTYKNDPGTALDSDDIGKAVVIIANGTVGLGWDGGRICGILAAVKSDGYVTVQDGGYKEEVPYSSLPAVGDRVVTNGSGSVKPVGSSAVIGDHEVVSVDTTNEKVVLKLAR
jgi:hypothetical protein